MRTRTRTKTFAEMAGLACAVALIAGACEQPATSPGSDAGTGTISQTLGERPAVPQVGTERQADAELFEVCKDYVGGVGPDVVVNVHVDSHEGGADFADFDITLGDGECVDVWVHGGTGLDVVTVTETVPSGFTGSFVKTVVGTNTAASGPGNSASGNVDGSSGVLVEFTNTLIPPPPPPPPPGGEGCTPGYWRNHAGQPRAGNAPPQPDSWAPTGFEPTDTFDATFGVTSGFGSSYTLLDAVNNPGAGEKIFAFHAVAALLNAAHPDVAYDLTVAEVIAAVQAAYGPGGDFETTKDDLAALNEQGCPL